MTRIFDLNEGLFLSVRTQSMGNLTIGTIYRPPSQSSIKNFNQYLRSELFNSKFSHTSKYIILGDMNINYLNDEFPSHIPTMDYFNLFIEFNFKFLINKFTRIVDHNEPSTIDHVWSNVDTQHQGFIVGAPISDHLPSVTLLEVKQAKDFRIEKFRDFSKRNIARFLKDKAKIFRDIYDRNASSKSNILNLFRVFKMVMKQYFPMRAKQITSKRKQCPWITRDIMKCINKKHAFFRLYRRGELNWSFFSHYSKLVHSLIELSRQIYFNSRFNKSLNNQKRMWKNIKMLNGEDTKMQIKDIISNKKIICDQKEISKIYNEFFTELAKEMHRKNPKPRNSYRIFPERKSMYMHPTDPYEVKRIIAGIKTGNGNETIPLRVIRLAIDEFALLLSNIFNQMICEGAYPDILKTGRVVPIYKSGSHKDIRNYRPVTILPVIDKILESLLVSRLSNFFENKMSTNQFGFCKGKNAEQAVLKLYDHIIPDYIAGKYIICIFADLSKAFDTVSIELLCDKLSDYGLRGVVNELLRSFLT